MIAYNASIKLLNYPTYMSYLSGNDLIFPALFNIILQSAIIWLITFLASKTDKTFYELLRDCIGEVGAKIVFALFALFFIANAILPMIEQQLFVHESFYDTIPSILVFLPFFILSIYAGSKRFTNIGRVADMCLPIFVVAIIVIFAMSIGQCRFDNLLPILRRPPSNIGGSSLSSIVRFSDSSFMLMFLGHFKYKKGDSLKITLSYIAGGLIVLLFMSMFYAIYGSLSPMQPFAIAKIPIFFSAINLIGRVDMLAIYLYDTAVLFALILNIQMSCYCLEKVFSCPLRGVYSIAVNAILITISIVFTNNFVALNDFFYKWMWLASLIFSYIFPLSLFIMKRHELSTTRHVARPPKVVARSSVVETSDNSDIKAKLN
jgi:spore germination protein KB